jgi:hypothetical protein
MDMMKIGELDHGDLIRTPTSAGKFVGVVRLKNDGATRILVCVQMPEIDPLTGSMLINAYDPEHVHVITALGE